MEENLSNRVSRKKYTPAYTPDIKPRDIRLLKDLFESRLMTLAQAAILHFDGKSEAAKKRIQKLKAGGYVSERRRAVRDPSILQFTRKGYEVLLDAGELAKYPRFGWERLKRRAVVADSTLQHELQVMDVKAAFVAAARIASPRLHIEQFSTWPALYGFDAYGPDGKLTPLRPDGFIRIHERDETGATFEQTFFLEVDRSHEVQSIIAAKAFCYRDYYRRGGLAIRHGCPAEQFKHFRFRVLFVCKTEERRNNIAQTLLGLSQPILDQVWLATLQDVTRDPLNMVWRTPKCYRDSHDLSIAKALCKQPGGN